MKALGVAVCIFALSIIGSGIAGSLYFLTFGGIVQFVEGCKATPTGAADIACGAVRFLLTGFGLWVSIVLGLIVFHLGLQVRKENY